MLEASLDLFARIEEASCVQVSLTSRGLFQLESYLPSLIQSRMELSVTLESRDSRVDAAASTSLVIRACLLVC